MNTPFTFKHTQPTNMDPTKKYPAIFLLHGMGSNEDDLPQLVQEFQGQCHIISLRGPITQKPGYAFFTIQEVGKPDRAIFDKVLIALQRFMLEAIEEFQIDPHKVYVLGFSQGAVLAQSLAFVMGNLITGIVALSGYTPKFVTEEYAIRTVNHLHAFISHGDYDYVIPSQWGVESKELFEQFGASVTFRQYPDGHGVTPENRQDLVMFLTQQLQENIQ
ncbi:MULTISPECIES: alpha/beta hydrolase [unclassified Lysinibacillus]|uniref:alpha/beta hydrolase n=1 Tax=unclassified Lysinibacillus TaxID=2636778 RepID=UPI00116938EF|nr:esterase [Lysinibacillus sp. CD3-6]QPQ35113.1 esterase [Lysinibacillus sp. JNUCC-52]UED78887.1 esterase [Lysinibacillus sp. CD3-6]